jgi:aspartyl-tRNA(Asn)/glutamyl-tRNA(Gln) amidotransferase subunit A
VASSKLTSLPVSDLSQLVQSREVSPVELTEAFLERIGQKNPELGLYINIAQEQARKQALAVQENLQKGSLTGPLQGIPYAIKDIFLTKNLTTTAGSLVLKDYQPDQDAAVVERLCQEDAILLGKTNLHEFSFGATGENLNFGTTRNPWDTRRLAGGSSSGSAAAVASGAAAFALGTDTGGSIRVPAALCGVVGFKPTYGLISTHAIIPFCWSLDHVGTLTRTVLDAALVLEALAGYDPRNTISARIAQPAYTQQTLQDSSPLRIGLPRNFFQDLPDPEIEQAVKHCINLLEEDGAILSEVDIPRFELSRTVSLLIQLPEMLSYHSRYFPEKKDLYGSDLLAGMAQAQFILAEHYVRAKRMMAYYREETNTLLDQVDLLLTPASPIVAPFSKTPTININGQDQPTGNVLTQYTSFFNLTGHPAIVLPCGWHSTGLPMSIQLVGRHFEESLVLRIAHNLSSKLQ